MKEKRNQLHALVEAPDDCEADVASNGRLRLDDESASDEDVRAVVAGAAKAFREALDRKTN